MHKDPKPGTEAAKRQRKPVIVFSLLAGSLTVKELRRILPDLTAYELNLQLQELEREGIVERQMHFELPPQIHYSLTPFGRSIEVRKALSEAE